MANGVLVELSSRNITSYFYILKTCRVTMQRQLFQ